MMRGFTFLLACATLLGGCFAAGPLKLTVTLRGKKYEVSGSSVSDIQGAMEDQAGLAKDQQSVLFKGKLLSADDDLAEAGISEGDTVNIVPSKKPRAAGAEAAVTAEEGASDPFGLGGLGGPGGMPGMEGMPDMTPENYQKMMNDMMNSPMMDEFLSDPEKIEESRQAILENPQLRQAMEQLPGFSDMIDDADKWRESMMMAKDVMQAQKEMISKSQETTDVDDLD